MRSPFRFAIAFTLASASIAAAPQFAAAQDKRFPTRPIELIIPYAPGGGSGITGEVMKKIITDEKLSPQPVSLTYKPGASGQLGWTYLATRKGNAYTIATATQSFSYGFVLEADAGQARGFHADRDDAGRHAAHGGIAAIGLSRR